MAFHEKTTSGRPEPFASILYAEPGALGLLCNILSALTVAIGNIFDTSDRRISLIVAGVHLILIGGVLQIIASFLAFRRNDHLTGTSFTVFAALWSNQGILDILLTSEAYSGFSKTTLPGFVGFMIITVILFVCSLFLNYIMPPVLAAMMLTLMFECVGQFFIWGKRVAAAFEFVIVLSAIYAVLVMTSKGVSQRYILPGFGNAPIDPLLIQTKAVGKKRNEKKKNTKYAEPMGMGYIGNIVPAVVLCFYHLGYISDFRLAMPAMICGFLCHIMASYYSFLRHDLFHTVQFILYFIFWTSRTLSPFFTAAGIKKISDDSIQNFGSWGLVVAILFLTFFSAMQNVILFIYNILISVTVILSLEHIPMAVTDYTFGISSAVVAVATIYLGVAALLNSIAEKFIVYVGPEVITAERFRLLCCCQRNESNEESGHKEGSENQIVIVDSLIFAANAVAALGLSPSDVTGIERTISLIVTAGVLVNLFLARLAYAAGSLGRCFCALVLVGIWTTWTLTAFNDINTKAAQISSVTVMCLQIVSILISFTFSRLWVAMSTMFLINNIGCVMLVFGIDVKYMTLVTSLLAGIICTYGMLSTLLKTLTGTDIFPQGHPILKYKEIEKQHLPCPVFASRKASDILECAKLLDQGHVVGIPTDTVYALGASCKHPESINAIYHIKGRPPEKPICLCISSLDQLKTANPPFSPLLWKFMDFCYPGGITCTVQKGNWLKNLGVGDSIDYIGKKDSVAIRVPDSSVLSYLTSVSGPLAITSANPSGEPDSLHHDMVISGLGHKLAGVVCDDESNEIKPSTVVNCLDIDKGVISYFRIGCVPQDKVDALFEKAKLELNSP